MTSDAPARWAPSDTLEAARRLKPTAGKMLFFLRHVADGPFTAAGAAGWIGCSLKTAYNALHDLEAAGLARETGSVKPARYEPIGGAS